MNSTRLFLIKIAGFMMLLSGAMTASSAEPYKLGVNAPRSTQETLNQWQDLGKYLSKTTGKEVEIVPMEVSKVFGDASAKKVDFILANPNQTLMLKVKLGATLLASLNGKQGSVFGGVVVVKKGGSISKIEDLKGKPISALGIQSAGGYLFQVYHFSQKGMQPRRDYGLFTTTSQDDSILAVQSGKSSAAFVRTGILENMAKEGKIKLDDFTILDERKDSKFPFLLTTELYPEYFVIALPHANKDVAAEIKTALLKMPASDPAAQTAGIKGFIEPLSTATLENAMRAVKAPPFE
ncbi:phosphate/phosphite/phosphonate ABC transporter substrate-binding protein [Undibacterium pigrum]|uniref:ABC-type phosphate/phosphonate transport system substrate-binding protein n=1 Tax=Undibacterium pigrum TaxID=401470 RepID=A0A318J626_9BURK|nr:PhnD/SsuA/transferrin family substrate-binding protein [Undibacterium pigrum]PXX43165.1 ABC-type phosphate/phosphonate transport system substrate-binding protein [Undibacterium pigrum]